MKGWLMLIILSILGETIAAQSAHKHLRTGDEAYEGQNYTQAEENYRKSLVKKKSTQGTYNLGNAIYQQERYEEAVKSYETAARTAQDNATKASANHNLGNAYFNQKEYEKSIEAYKNALRLNSQDVETKTNLAIAQRLLKIQQEKQQQNQQNQQKQDPQKNEQQQPEQPQQQQQNQSQSSAPEQPQNLSKEEANKLLEIMEQEEEKVQKKLRKAQTKPNRSTKDW